MNTNAWNTLVQPEADELRLWELFHENSKVSRWDEPPSADEVLARMDALHQTLPYDAYPAVALPLPSVDVSMSVKDAVLRRRTARTLAARPISLDTLATILSLTYGITSQNEGTVYTRPFRAVPSGGALYPLEIYLHTIHVDGLEPGLFHYNPMKHELRHLRHGDRSREISEALMQRETPYESSVMLFVTAMFERSTFKYGERGYRFALLEAGHVAQNVNLTAVALGLGVRSMGGFLDHAIDAVLGLDGVTQSTVYMIALGELIDDGVAAVQSYE